MKIFFDFEMTGLHQRTTPISLGMIAENGRTFYAEFTDYDKSQVVPWIEEHVLSQLVLTQTSFNEYGVTMTGDLRGPEFTIIGKRNPVTIAVKEWISQFSDIEMWGDVLAWDWILFCELFESEDLAERLPNNVYYIPFDIATVMETKGVDPDISREVFAAGAGYTPFELGKHNALSDAIVIKHCYERLAKL